MVRRPLFRVQGLGFSAEAKAMVRRPLFRV
jgi:hypothetical protein